MNHNLRLVILLASLIALLSTLNALGKEPTSPVRTNLICNPSEQKYNGIEYCTWKDPGTGIYTHVIVVDLTSPGIKIEYVIANGKDRNGNPVECRDVNIPSASPKGDGCRDVDNENYYPILSLAEAVQRFSDAAVVINSDYGAGDQGSPGEFRGHGPEGLAIIQKTRIDGPVVGDYDDPNSTNPNTNNAVRRPWLILGETAPLLNQVKMGQILPDQDTGGNPEPWAYTGVGGGPWLVKDGAIQTDDIKNCKNASANSCAAGKAQTAVGITQDNKRLFFVVNPQTSTLNDMAQMMADELGVWQAFKFDGGGSTQLWYGGKTSKKTIEPGDGRKLSQYLAIRAVSGSGINTGGQAACPPANCTEGRAVSHDYFVQVVQNLKDVPLSDFAADVLEAWKPYENTRACWNPLATTWQMADVCYFNCLKKDANGNCTLGVQNYQNQDTGVKATANTLNLSYYDAIRRMLRYEAFEREELRKALGTWGTCKDTRCDPLLDDWQELWDANQNVVQPPAPAPTEPPSGGGLPWWDQIAQSWQDFIKSVSDTWQRITQTVAEIQQAIQDFQQFVQDVQDPYWWTQQFTQCCGTAVLPAAAAGVFWWRRRAKR